MNRPLKKPLVAVLLSLLYTGLGQAYNRQPLKAVLFAILPLSAVLASSWVGGLHTFARLVLVLAIVYSFELLVAIDAWRVARRADEPSASREAVWLSYACLAAFLVAQLLLLGNVDYLGRIVRVRAFRMPSSSMIPTILKEERIIADMRAYREESPKQGDLAIVDLHDRGPFVRRVVALPGDVVSGNIEEGIRVNGQPLPEPHWREELPWLSSTTVAALFEFEPITIGHGEVFLLGDNYVRGIEPGNPRLNLVRLEQVQGKPLYIYWSEDSSRIGRPLE